MPVARDLERLNANLPPFMHLLNGKVDAFDVEAGTASLSFAIEKQYCHSIDIVQGGFITAMLDAAMSHAVFACDDTVVSLASLEISTRYLEVTRAGALIALGRIVRQSYKTAFMEGELRDTQGKLLATTQSVAKIVRKRAES